MKIDLKGKTAFVGGSTQGIGWATAQIMANAGAEVVLLGRNPEVLAKNQKTLEDQTGRVHFHVTANFTDTQNLQEKISAFAQNHQRAHILVNNAGGPPPGPLHQASLDALEDAFSMHLKANHVLMQALLPFMKASQYGRILNVISTSVKQPLPNLGVSNTIRGAVANWAKTLANELGPYGITVNNVLPGATATGRLDGILENKSKKMGVSIEDAAKGMTDAIPAKRFAHADELAYALCFLASDKASYINGINVPVDGGRTGSL